MCAAKCPSPNGSEDESENLEIPLALFLGLMGFNPLFSLIDQSERTANRTTRAGLKKKYGYEIGRFRESTGNVAAIDFGTTYCSLAFMCDANNKTLSNLKLNETFARVPTAILLEELDQSSGLEEHESFVRMTAEYKVKCFGYWAQKSNRGLKAADRSKHLYFERFKMSLQQDENVSRNMTIKASSGENFYLVEVLAFIFQYLKDELEAYLDNRKQFNSGSSTAVADFEWVITVPAIWKSKGKRLVREAAYLAGLCSQRRIRRFTKAECGIPRPEEKNPDKLTLALEPEAAAIYCQTMSPEHLLQHSMGSGSLRSSRYIVVDIGGGTVDITAHHHEHGQGIEVIVEPSGNNCGGTKVNHEFLKLLQKIFQDEPAFGDDPYSLPRFVAANGGSQQAKHQAIINKLVHEDFEKYKVHFGSQFTPQDSSQSSEESADIVIQIPNEICQFYSIKKIIEGVNALNDPRIELDDDNLFISGSKMHEFFQPAIDGILSCTSSVLERLKDDIDTVYLVGGFGGSSYVYHNLISLIKSNFENNNIRVIVPKDHALAVSEGAVKYRLNPDIIHSRVMDATYGTDVCPPYIPGVYNQEYIMGRDEKGCIRVRDVFLKYVEKEEVLTADEVVTAEFLPLCSSAEKMAFPLYSTYDKNVKYVKDSEGNPIKSIRKIGAIEIEIPNQDGLDRSKRSVEMTMDFSHSEIQVRARYIVTGAEIKTTVDFLSDSV